MEPIHSFINLPCLFLLPFTLLLAFHDEKCYLSLLSFLSHFASRFIIARILQKNIALILFFFPLSAFALDLHCVFIFDLIK